MVDLDKLERLFKKGELSRREFITRVSALGATAMLAPVLGHSPAHAKTPTKGGTLRIGADGGSTNDTLDPTGLVSTMSQHLSNQMRNGLAELDAFNKAVPELAESWEASPDAKKWVIKLKKRVEFHNGKTMDAEDVMYSLNLHRGEKTKSSAKVLLEQVEGMKADGKDAIVVTLKSGNADFPYVLSNFNMCIVPKDTTDFSKGIGTGPYVLQEFEPGVRCFVKKNHNYFKKDRAHFDAVETVAINDTTARTTALQTGKIDVMNRPDLKTINLLGKNPKLQIVKIQGAQHFSIPMRTDVKPFDNKDVRLALKYAIDREQIVKTILQGYGDVGNDNPISKAYRYFDADLPQRPYDPDKAKFHIKKAGAAGEKFELFAADSAFTGAVDTAIIYKGTAAKAGINIEVVKTPADGYWSDVWMKKPWCFCWWYGRPTEDWVFSTTYAENAAWNDTFWKNERFNKLLTEARAELDDAKRQAMYSEMQQILSDDGGVVIPVFVNYLLVASNGLAYDKVAPSFEWDSFKISERWWFA